ncbi:MAG: hypothetical protein ACYCS2_09570 [Acidimicrobiales bacterium]
MEISASIAPITFEPGTGGGIGRWIELNSGGVGADGGEVTRTSDRSRPEISRVVISGDAPVNIRVRESGHEGTDLAAVFTPLVSFLPGQVGLPVARRGIRPRRT